MSGTRIDILWESYRLPPKFQNARFSNYHPQHKSQEIALVKCQKYADAGLENIIKGKGLFLHGAVGTGKTHLAVATAYEIIRMNENQFARRPSRWEDDTVYEPGYRFTFTNFVELLATIKESFEGNEEQKRKARDVLHRVRADSLVILDDIGAEKPSGWVEEQFYGIINLRYEMQRATIITTNCSPTDLEKQVGVRVVDRIFEMSSGVKVEGPSYRKKKIT